MNCEPMKLEMPDIHSSLFPTEELFRNNIDSIRDAWNWLITLTEEYNTLNNAKDFPICLEDLHLCADDIDCGFSYDRKLGLFPVGIGYHENMNTVLYVMRNWQEIVEDFIDYIISNPQKLSFKIHILHKYLRDVEHYSQEWLSQKGTAMNSNAYGMQDLIMLGGANHLTAKEKVLFEMSFNIKFVYP